MTSGARAGADPLMGGPGAADMAARVEGFPDALREGMANPELAWSIRQATERLEELTAGLARGTPRARGEE